MEICKAIDSPINDNQLIFTWAYCVFIWSIAYGGDRWDLTGLLLQGLESIFFRGGRTGSMGGTQPPQGGCGPGHGCGQSEHGQLSSSVQSVSQQGG